MIPTLDVAKTSGFDQSENTRILRFWYVSAVELRELSPTAKPDREVKEQFFLERK